MIRFGWAAAVVVGIRGCVAAGGWREVFGVDVAERHRELEC